MKLTKKVVDGKAYQGPGRCVYWDSHITGLGLRVYPSGKKSFVLSYRVNGRKRLMVLGKYGELFTAEDARNKAKEELGTITRGVDPLGIKKLKAKLGNVNELCDTFLKQHAKKKKKSWKADERRINQHIKPALGTLKAVAVTPADVAHLHAKIGEKRPYEANRTLRLISKMFKVGTDLGIVPEGHRNPATGIEQFPEKSRDRFVESSELPFLAQAINEEQQRNYFASKALWLYLLTGIRKSELLTAKWEDVNLERGEFRLPETKNGETHYLPLSEPALAILRELPRVNKFVLPGKQKGGHLVNISKAWLRVRDRATVLTWHDRCGAEVSKAIEELTERLKRAPRTDEIRSTVKDCDFPGGVLDVRLHDLRRTVGSWMAHSGNSLHLIGRVLNHKSQQTTAIYARFAQDQIRQALDDHGKRIASFAESNKAPVLPLKKRA